MASSTTLKQRVGIWIITLVTLVGTIFSFVVMIVASENSASDQQAQQDAYNKYQTAVTDYQSKSKVLAAKYYEKMLGFASYPAVFDKAGVTGVTSKDYEVGTGDTIDSSSDYVAYYIGWNPDGKIFDQSIDDINKTLKDPLPGVGLIPGWTQGVIGMKYGGVRELTIPSDKAYGATGSGELIPANTPLKFIVFILPKDEIITAPKYTDYIKV